MQKAFAQEISKYFHSESSLFQNSEFEDRPQQRIFSEGIQKALKKKHSLIIEAGTGIGKSLGYLLPCAIHALEKEQRIIISTQTIHLQEQLLLREIPKVSNALGKEISVMVLKGRKNYLCTTRLQKAQLERENLFNSSEREELQKILHWADQTEEGTVGDLPFLPQPNLWENICSTVESCHPKKCSENHCFYQKAKRRIASSHLIIVNHALLFSHLLKEKRDTQLIPLESIFVFDEAHTLPQVVRDQFTLTWKPNVLPQILHKLYHPKKKIGLFKNSPSFKQWEEKILVILQRSEMLNQEISNKFSLTKGNTFLLKEKIGKDATISKQIESLCEEIQETEQREEGKEIQTELREIRKALREEEEKNIILFEAKEKSRAYWMNRTLHGNLHLNGTPIEIEEIIQEHLLTPPRISFFISATLSTGRRDKKLDYYQKEIGATKIETQKIDSTFDYSKQAKVRIYANLPYPNSPEHSKILCQKIAESISLTEGKTLVLFTSHQALRKTAEGMKSFFEKKGWNLLVQEKDQSRNHLLQKFREEIDSVLFGVESFWSGVDISGKSLSQVIITRLPFHPPDNPVSRARGEKKEKGGENAFYSLSMPEALLRFRQGIGRLIRSKKDEGILTILDSRIIHSSYGKKFQEALPEGAPIEIIPKT